MRTHICVETGFFDLANEICGTLSGLEFMVNMS